MAHWSDPWTRVQFADHGRGPQAYDCYGLYRAVLAAEFGIALPEFCQGYASVDDHAAIGEAIQAGLATHFFEVGEGQEREGDMILLHLSGRPWHLGMVLAGRRFLHILDELGAGAESYDTPRWHSRIGGFYRAAV